MRLAKRMTLMLVVTVAVLYAGFCAALFVFQRSFLYFPQPRFNSADSTVLRLPVGAETTVVSAHLQPGPDALLYFGGNAEDVSQSTPDIAAASPGKAIYLLHYPGYGGSSGKPSQQAIFAVALAVFDRLHAEHPNIVVVGRSLGSGVAVWIASQRPVARLVLVTPYDSLTDAAAELYPYLPVRWLMRDKYDSWRYAGQVTAPTRILVAGDDEVIPRSSSERLRTRFRENLVSYAVLPGAGHNTIQDSPDYWRLISAN